MKRLIVICIAAISALCCTPESINSTNEKDVYFVRYVSSSSGAYVTYTKEDGTKTTLTRPSTENGVFERIVGPVYKGFSCTFSIDRGTGINDIPLRIEIKKNDEPFVVKVEGIYSVKYTIE